VEGPPRITALEETLGLKLFERNPRGYNLTQHGEALLGMASAMEAEAVRTGESAAGQQLGLTGVVRISTPEGFGNFFLAPRIGELVASHPRLAVEMITIQQIVALSRREADIAVSMTVPPNGNFVEEHLTDYRLTCTVRAPISMPRRPSEAARISAIIRSSATSTTRSSRAR